jgi:hypothetical protein
MGFVLIAVAMSAMWLRKGTWGALGAATFAIGAVGVHFFGGQARAVLATAPLHDVISRAADSEIEVGPSLAASSDGTLAVAWVALMGGRDDGGRYVAARVSAPNGGALARAVRVTTASGDARVSDATVVPLAGDPHAFLVTWLSARTGEAGEVYCARLSPTAVTPAVRVATDVRGHVRTTTTPEGAVLIFTPGARGGLTLSTTHDGATFTHRDVLAPEAAEPSEDAGSEMPEMPEMIVSGCSDEHHALALTVDVKRGVRASDIPIDPEGPVQTTDVSAPSEHVARDAPTCFITGQEAFVVYGVAEKSREDAEVAIADSLIFARSRDNGHTFSARVTYRPSSRLLHPAFLHAAGSFTMLAVMGGGIGDAHASASVIMLNADGRSQNGLTRTVLAPLTLVASRDAAGYMGDTLGLAVVGGVTWAAVVDNASGESHVALVHVL